MRDVRQCCSCRPQTTSFAPQQSIPEAPCQRSPQRQRAKKTTRESINRVFDCVGNTATHLVEQCNRFCELNHLIVSLGLLSELCTAQRKRLRDPKKAIFFLSSQNQCSSPDYWSPTILNNSDKFDQLTKPTKPQRNTNGTKKPLHTNRPGRTHL
jgi:hypothetical protein